MFESAAACDVGFALAGFDERGAAPGDLIEALAASARGIAWLQARQAELVAEIARREPEVAAPRGMSPLQPAADEVAAVLRLSTSAALVRVHNAVALTQRETATLAALRTGRIQERTAWAIVEATAPLPAAAAADVERRTLRRADGQTPAQVRAVLRRAVMAADPRSAAERCATARAARRVSITPLDDGMAELRALLAATDAVRVAAALDSTALAAASTAAAAGAAPTGEAAATFDQRRADALVALVTGAASPGAPARILVTVPAGTVLGVTDEPGHLAGFGPIPADLARDLAADGVWRRVLTDPSSGAVLDVGRRTYRPPADLDRFVRTRDAHCRFPGCRRRADRGDVDHAVRFPEGPTAAHNLYALCRRHHRLKHETGWRLTPLGHGRLEWTSPLGAIHITEPAGPGGEAYHRSRLPSVGDRADDGPDEAPPEWADPIWWEALAPWESADPG